MGSSAGEALHIQWLTKPVQLHRDGGHTQRAAGLRRFLVFPFLLPTEKWQCAPSMEGWEQRGAQGWVWETSAELRLSWYKCFFSTFKHARDGKRCVLRSAHRQAKSRGNTDTHSRAPSAFWVPDWAIWDCHFCRLKMIQYPPQQRSQQFYF